MARRHPSTAAQRVQWVSRMIAHTGAYGLVASLSRAGGASLQARYAWCARAGRAGAGVPHRGGAVVGNPRLAGVHLTDRRWSGCRIRRSLSATLRSLGRRLIDGRASQHGNF